MRLGNITKILLLVFGALICLGMETNAFAISGIGSVASQVKGNLKDVARLVTAGAYLAGMAFAVAAIVKFKAHKDNPTQVPISQGVVLLFVAAALMFSPAVFKTAGVTLFQDTTQAGSLSGSTGFATT